MVESLRKAGSFGFDVETTGLDPYRSELRLMQFSPDPERAFLIDLRHFDTPLDPRLKPVRDVLDDRNILKIGHNLKFDAKFVKHHLGSDVGGVFDTFLASKIEACGVAGIQHGLKDVVGRLLGLEVDKSEQISDWGASELSERQLEYAARDVCVLHDLESKLTKRLISGDLLRVANLENSIVMAMAQVELNGIYLDAEQWKRQLELVRGQAVTSADALQDLLSGGNRQTGLFGRLEIDLASQRQVAEALLGLGVPVPMTDKGNYTTNKDLLEPLRYEYPSVEKLQEWRALNKQITSYGENILDLIHPVTGRIHADFQQLRAPGGRMGCNNPNLQNVPQDEAYRSCFKAGEGNVFIVADFSQIELRVMADYSEDEGMIAAFKSGKDFHSETARQVCGLGPDDEIPTHQRTLAKTVNFGIGYGAGPSKLARMCKISVEEAEVFIQQYFESRPGLDKWLKKQRYIGVRHKFVRTRSGRRVKFREFNRYDRGETGQIERLACNIPIQGTAADVFKRALCLIHEQLKGTGAKIVNLVHDEFVIESPEGSAEENSRIVEECMSQAGSEFVNLVPVTADAKILKEWSK